MQKKIETLLSENDLILIDVDIKDTLRKLDDILWLICSLNKSSKYNNEYWDIFGSFEFFRIMKDFSVRNYTFPSFKLTFEDAYWTQEDLNFYDSIDDSYNLPKVGHIKTVEQMDNLVKIITENDWKSFDINDLPKYCEDGTNRSANRVIDYFKNKFSSYNFEIKDWIDLWQSLQDFVKKCQKIITKKSYIMNFMTQFEKQLDPNKYVQRMIFYTHNSVLKKIKWSKNDNAEHLFSYINNTKIIIIKNFE